MFHKTKNYDSHLITRLNRKTKVIPNKLKIYMSCTINNKLSFIESCQFQGSSFTNVNKDDFMYLNQEFDNNVLNLVKQKAFYPYEYMTDFENFTEELTCKKKFYSSIIS